MLLPFPSSFIKLSPYSSIEAFEHFLLNDYHRTKFFLTNVNPDILEEISKKKAVHIFKSASSETPAYQKFLKKNKLNPQSIKSIEDFDNFVPQTDKANYIKKYSFEERCHSGHLPTQGNIDESGGTSGKATNWIHDFSEENLLFKAINFEYNYVFDGEKNNYLVISAWSTGPWATGVKFCELMEKIALVKNTATDPQDIIETMKMFGKNRNYLLSGYPPFLKNLIDDTSDQINWKDYHIDIVTGGEGVPLEWVYYLKKKLKPGAKIISSYGASDIDIGVGFESPFCFFIRELAAKNEKLRAELFGKDELPMLFQYNPTMHYIRQIKNSEGKDEFEITLLDKNVALPKIKYNLHDEGRKHSFNEMSEKISKYYPNYLKDFARKNGNVKDILNLPFLSIFGRSDGTLSFDGANVFPDQIESGILSNPELAKVTNRFKMEKKYDKKHTAQFLIHIELKNNYKANPKLKKQYSQSILNELLKLNPDYRESYSHNKTVQPIINLCRYEHPLFKQDDLKVKNIYFSKI